VVNVFGVLRRSPPSHFHNGDYVTDRRRLYRVLEIRPAKRSQRAAILEDCRTLEATHVEAGELSRMQLRLVRGALVW
jgi:predicted Ser/Thr protein kinase